MLCAMLHRLFLALWPPPAARDAVLAARRQWAWPPGTACVPAERLHVTLHFIGNVSTAQLAQLGPALALRYAPFELALAQLECWPHGLVVWRAAPSAALQGLHDALGDALTNAGLPPLARPYRPHLTLARRAAGVSLPPQPPPLTWQVSRYALVESQQGYVTLREYALADAY